ncbi:MAG: T9SS type A sorting domain-containing protein [Flavobacteriia bacterium]|nr:T9SS type A sorting domain-containing protein [Flavobacteriia bacterium]
MKLKLVFLFVLIVFFIRAQVEWVYPLDPNITYENSFKTDNEDNVVQIGYSYETIDVDFQQSNYYIENEDKKTYIVKYSPSGKLNWVKQFSKNIHFSTFNLGRNDDIYITGSFYGTEDFDPNEGVYELKNESGSFYYEFFILKLDKNGNFIWAKNLEGSTLILFSNAFLNSIIDEEDNIYVTASFMGDFDADPGEGEHIIPYVNTLDPQGDIYVGKYTKDGEFVWGHAFGTIYDDCLSAMNFDKKGNFYFFLCTDYNKRFVKINLNGTIELNSEPVDLGIEYEGKIMFNSNNQLLILSNRYLTKYSIDSFQKLEEYYIEGNSINNLFILIDKTDNIWILGNYRDSIDFDNSENTFYMKANGEYEDIFLIKLSSNFKFINGISFGGVDKDDAVSVKNFNLSKKDEKTMVLKGSFNSNLTFSPNLYPLSFHSKIDLCYVLKLNLELKNIRIEECDEFLIFPNPINDILNIYSPFNNKMEISLYNNFGDLIYFNDKENNFVKMNLENFNNGYYHIKVESEFCTVNKLILKH